MKLGVTTKKQKQVMIFEQDPVVGNTDIANIFINILLKEVTTYT